MKVVSVEQMRSLDYKTINESGVPGKELMRRAGVGAGERILEYINGLNPAHVKRFVILAGKGNNGGDGFVVAKYLHEKTNCEVIIYSVSYEFELKGAAKTHAENIHGDIPFFVKRKLHKKHFSRGDIVIDCLLGTGFKGKLKEEYLEWINLVNSLHLPVIAIDIPSGLNGDTGEVEEAAIAADLTIYMGMPKTGLLVSKGPVYCGRIKGVDIGIPESYQEAISSECNLFTGHDAYKIYDRLYMEAHKNSYGSILVIGGSKLYPGAPFLTGKSALRAGAGIAVVAVPANSNSFNTGTLALIPRSIEDDGTGFFTKSSVQQLLELTEKADVVVIGPGMSDTVSCKDMLEELIKINKPLVVDADALNIIAKFPEILPNEKNNIVFTPHHGEIKRLFTGFNLDFDNYKTRIDKARVIAEKMHGIMIYKGNRTVTVSPDLAPTINGSGGPALATAGSGDVLSGIISANIGAGMNLFDSSCLGVYIHGITGEIGNKGARGLIADDIVELVPHAIKRATPFA